MQYSMRWLQHGERHRIQALSDHVYKNEKNNYPNALNSAKSSLFDLFLIPANTVDSDIRRVLGVFDDSGHLITAVGARSLKTYPCWYLSWTISEVQTIAFVKIWRDIVQFLCRHYESQNLNEFYVISPCDREEAYRRLMQPLRTKYWTFVETKISSGMKPDFSLYWSIMGYTLYPYDINIRRYILKRDPDEKLDKT